MIVIYKNIHLRERLFVFVDNICIRHMESLQKMYKKIYISFIFKLEIPIFITINLQAG